MSVQFDPLSAWRAVHAGLYWSLVKDRYPLNETQPPLPSQIERFDDTFNPQVPLVTFSAVDIDLSRFWFLSEDGTNLIQIQRDRLVVNWRQQTGDEVYPRYEPVLRLNSLREWEDFQRFHC